MNPFEKLLVELGQSEVNFLTIGGVACAFNGLVRTTEDVDILIDQEKSNVEKFLHFVDSFSPTAAKELSLSDFKDEEGAIRIIEDFPLDVFVRISGYTFKDLVKYLRKYKVEDIEIPYLGKEGLILLKSQSLREIDQRDVIQLKSLT